MLYKAGRVRCVRCEEFREILLVIIDKELARTNKELKEIHAYKKKTKMYRSIGRIMGRKDWTDQSDCFYFARLAFLEDLKRSIEEIE